MLTDSPERKTAWIGLAPRCDMRACQIGRVYGRSHPNCFWFVACYLTHVQSQRDPRVAAAKS